MNRVFLVDNLYKKCYTEITRNYIYTIMKNEVTLKYKILERIK